MFKIFKRIFKKKPSNLFIYKWGVLSGVIESLLILFSAFTIINLYELFAGNQNGLLITLLFYLVIAFIISFFVVFGMPLYLAFKKKMIMEALLVLLITIAVLIIFFTFLFLILN